MFPELIRKKKRGQRACAQLSPGGVKDLSVNVEVDCDTCAAVAGGIHGVEHTHFVAG